MKNVSFEQIAFNGLDDINLFPLYLTEVSGFVENSVPYNDILNVVKSQQDLEKWVNAFDGDFNPKAMIATTERYKASLVA